MFKRIMVVANPGAGRPQPVLHTLNRIFHETGAEWDIAVTRQDGDAERLAREATRNGFDVVAAYGGDGTVTGVATGLLESDVPMAILPGGTANVMSAELGIPQELREAAQLLCIDAPTRALDMGRMGERMFLLRVSIGLAADMVKATDRERKERYGALAYAMSFLEQMRDSNESDYTLTLDGERVNSRGVTCLINNAGHLGSMNLRLAADIDVSDGLLDVFVLGQGEPALLRSMLMQMAPGQLSQSLEQLIDNNFQRWKVRDVTVEIDSPQTVQADGEVLGNTPVTASVLPQAVRVVVPPPSDETQT